MEFADLLAGRRSTRRFDTTREVSDAVLERVLAAPLAMPHAGNTYDWRGIVLRRRDRNPATWPAVFSALLEQSYIDEAAVVVVWSVQPDWWAERYRANVAELVNRRLIDPARHRGLLAMVEAGPEGGAALSTLLIGEAMMGVAAAMLAALDSGLGATVTACRPAALAAALNLPGGTVVCPAGVLALGWPATATSATSSGHEFGIGAAPTDARPAAVGGAPKPALEEMYFAGGWGQPLPLGEPVR